MSDRGQQDGGWGPPHELLVVLDGDTTVASAALERVTGWGRVTSRLEPRLALVLLPAERVGDARGVPGVAGVFEEEVPAALLGTLRPEEQLFVGGWQARGRPKPSRRRDGEPWDAPT
ncbi:hypothetical protein [Parafrankia elaeagni]|uniref:hypothetical protein n=1 Tax=Parafrankia elaeagni TaxID=222534 RepID=UPI0003658B65|nr:hypothetical protein [Parafrankia elaeagni]